jgi:hypothetical protein
MEPSAPSGRTRPTCPPFMTRADPVSGSAVVVPEHPTKSFAADDLPRRADLAVDQLVADSLMVAFDVIVLEVLVDRAA